MLLRILKRKNGSRSVVLLFPLQVPSQSLGLTWCCCSQKVISKSGHKLNAEHKLAEVNSVSVPILKDHVLHKRKALGSIRPHFHRKPPLGYFGFGIITKRVTRKTLWYIQSWHLSRELCCIHCNFFFNLTFHETTLFVLLLNCKHFLTLSF